MGVLGAELLLGEGTGVEKPPRPPLGDVSRRRRRQRDPPSPSHPGRRRRGPGGRRASPCSSSRPRARGVRHGSTAGGDQGLRAPGPRLPRAMRG